MCVNQNSDFCKILKIKTMSYLDSSHFSDINAHIICSILINDMNYAILNELKPKNNKTHF